MHGFTRSRITKVGGKECKCDELSLPFFIIFWYLSKVSEGWVPFELSSLQKINRIYCCSNNFALENGDECLSTLKYIEYLFMKHNKTWLYFCMQLIVQILLSAAFISGEISMWTSKKPRQLFTCFLRLKTKYLKRIE